MIVAGIVKVNASRLRMATLPEGCDVLWTPGLWVPMVKLRQVHILPGIPRLFKQMLASNMDSFRGQLSGSRLVYTLQGEGDIAETITRIASAHPTVAIGSYPATTADAPYATKLTLDSRDLDALEHAFQAMIASVDVLHVKE